MGKYLIIKNIEVTKANANPVWYMVAPPAITAYHGFVQALLLNLINDDYKFNSKNLLIHEGFAIVHHDIQMLGTMKQTTYGKVFTPNQISSSTAYDKDDYVDVETINENTGKKKKIKTNKIASQPTATCNLLCDLIIKMPREISTIDLDKVKEFLFYANLAGGKINSQNVKVEITESYSNVLRQIKNGFFIIDRHKLLKMKEDKSQLDLLLENTRTWKEKTENSWLVPNSVGYITLSKFENEKTSRNGNEVAFAEPLVTLTQYVPVKKMKKIPFWNWEQQSINSNRQIFILKGEQNESN